MFDWDYWLQIFSARSPTLVIHRRKDRAVPYRLGRELAARSWSFSTRNGR